METARSRRRNRWRWAIWGTAASLLLLPAIAMRFPGTGVDWDARDFIIMGVMFFIACGSYEVVARISDNTAYRAASGIAIVTAFLTVWVNLAAGMLGSERNPANLLFGGVTRHRADRCAPRPVPPAGNGARHAGGRGRAGGDGAVRAVRRLRRGRRCTSGCSRSRGCSPRSCSEGARELPPPTGGVMDAVRRMTTTSNVVEWLFALLVIAVGVANLVLVDPVPALAYGLAALVYVPPANAVLKDRFGISIHPVAKSRSASSS
jgi:hypothetical protein